MSRFYNIGEIMLSGIPSGCVFQGDSVPGVSASLQPPATVWDRFAIKIRSRLKQLVPHQAATSNFIISPKYVIARVGWHRLVVLDLPGSQREEKFTHFQNFL